MKIENLLQTIGIAVQEAHKAIEYNSVNQFFGNYFDKTEKNGGDITYTPKIVEVEIPASGPRGNSKVLYTPIAALVQHKNLNLDCVKLNLNIDVSEETDGGLQVSAQGANSVQDNTESKRFGTLEITLKCSDTAEGIARIETKLHEML